MKLKPSELYFQIPVKELDAIEIAMGVERIEPTLDDISDMSPFFEDEDYELRLVGVDLFPFFNEAMVRRVRIHGLIEKGDEYQEDLSWHPDEGEKYLAVRKNFPDDIRRIPRSELLDRLTLWELGFTPANLEKIVKHLAVTDQALQETLKKVAAWREGGETKITSLKNLQEPVRLLEATDQVIKFEGRNIEIPPNGSFNITVKGIRNGIHNTVTCSKIEPGAKLLWNCAPEDEVIIQVVPGRTHVSNSLISAINGLRDFFSGPSPKLATSSRSQNPKEIVS